jgi:hypothetical protein
MEPKVVQPRPVFPLTVLTVRQPWASAIIFAGKDVENRSWAASYRGRLLILGHVRLIDCTRLRTESRWAMPGQWHWLISSAVALREPVPCKGQRGLWTVPDDAAAAVLAQLEPEVTHLCPPDGGDGLFPCCGLTPFEVPSWHRMTLDPALVTCGKDSTEEKP